MELKNILPPVKPRVTDVRFSPMLDTIDYVAQSEIPVDGPSSLKAVVTTGDGNCLC